MSAYYSRQLARLSTLDVVSFQEVQYGPESDIEFPDDVESMYFRSYSIDCVPGGATELTEGYHTDIDHEATHFFYVTKETEIMAAEIAAWPPVLAVLEAQQRVPRMAEHEGDSELPFITVALEVKWDRVFGILFGHIGWADFSD
jgi:hypothetical protein